MNKKEFLKNVYKEHIYSKFKREPETPCLTEFFIRGGFDDTAYTSFTRKYPEKNYTRNINKFIPLSEKVYQVKTIDPDMEVAHLSNVRCRDWFFPWFKVKCFTLKDDEVIEQKPHRPGKCPFCKYERAC